MILNEELIEKLNQFKDAFSEPLPLMMIPQHIDNAKLILLIDDCIRRKENNILELLNIVIKDNELY